MTTVYVLWDTSSPGAGNVLETEDDRLALKVAETRHVARIARATLTLEASKGTLEKFHIDAWLSVEIDAWQHERLTSRRPANDLERARVNPVLW